MGGWHGVWARRFWPRSAARKDGLACRAHFPSRAPHALLLPRTLQGASSLSPASSLGFLLPNTSNIADFLELTAPANLPPDMCPSWLSEECWVGWN